MTQILLICRNCGARMGASLAVNEQELANVGMLERPCAGCGRETLWGLAEDYRRRDRRLAERRHGERRMKLLVPPSPEERRRTRERRLGDMRRAQRRKSS